MEKEKEIHLIHYLGKRRALVGRYVKCFLLDLLTVGCYGSWGVTGIRKYLIRNIQIGQDRLAYSGKGLHLFLGIILFIPYCIVVVLLFTGVPYLLFVLMAALMGYIFNGIDNGMFRVLVMLPLDLALFFTWCCYQLEFKMCSYVSWRYVLSRLSWRGIRGSFQGFWFRYGFLCIYRTGLNTLSLTLLTPSSDLVKYKYLMERSRIGKTPFSVQSISIKRLFLTHVKTLLLFPFTLGLSRFWYQAALRNHQWNHTAVGNLRLRSTYTGWGLCKLYVGNFFLLLPPFVSFAYFALILIYNFILKKFYIFSFLELPVVDMGVIGYIVCALLFYAYLAVFLPVVVHRNARYTTQHIAVLGDLELFFEAQEAQKEALLDEPVELPSIDFGFVFPV